MIGIGTDVVDIERFRHSLRRTPSLKHRVFTPAEREYCESRNDPTERYAARFAAKEAVLKALGVGLGAADFHDIEVVRDGDGAPSLRLAGRAAALSVDRGVVRWFVSLSHTATVAQAFVIADDASGSGSVPS